MEAIVFLRKMTGHSRRARFSTPAVLHPLARVSGDGRNRLRQKPFVEALRGQDETRYSSADINAVYSHHQLGTNPRPSTLTGNIAFRADIKPPKKFKIPF